MGVGNVSVGHGLEFAADDGGGESRAVEAAVERGELLFVDFAPIGAQLALDALPDQGGFVGLLRDLFQSCLDVAVGNTASTQLARHAKFSLFSSFGAVARKLVGVARVVKQSGALQPGHYVFYKRGVFAAALERLLHLTDGMRAAHKDFDGGVVEDGFGVELPVLGEHRKKMKYGSKEVKR